MISVDKAARERAEPATRPNGSAKHLDAARSKTCESRNRPAVRVEHQHTVATTLGSRLLSYRLTITGLQPGALNVIMHKILAGPRDLRNVIYRPQASGGWHESKPADSRSLYLYIEPNGPTSFIVELQAEARYVS